MKIGFIGAGKVGSAFGRYLRDIGFSVLGYYSKNIESARNASDFTGSQCMELQELIEKCNYIFITTPDDAISDVWIQIRKYNLQDKKIFHMSGSLSSEVFQGIDRTGAFGYSLHPLFPFTDKNIFSRLSSAVFTIEGKYIKLIEDFLACLNVKYYEIDAHNKVKYHAAAVFASNYVVCLSKIAKNLFLECGLPESAVAEAVYPLVLGAVENIRTKGIEKALTGPIIRGDIGTVKKHREVLGNVRDIYDRLGIVALEISTENDVMDESKACELMKVLGGINDEKNSSNI